MSPTDASLLEVDTPALLVDRDRLDANISRFAAMASRTGVALRPHIKTHKTLEIAALQVQAGASGITCAKLGEAEVYADAGFTDVFVAYPLIGQEKARRAAQLARRCTMTVGVESVTGIQQLSMAASEADVLLNVRLELDSGLRRTGVAAAEALELCRLILAAPALHLDGIFTFRGVSFPGAPTRESDVLGQQEGEWMVAQAELLRAAGIPINAVSVGSTFTAAAAACVPGVTEVRPGTYVFFDRMTTKGAANTLDEIALSVLATVVSRPAQDMAIIDAGSKTFSGDVVPAAVGLKGYGVTVDGHSGILERMNEEHGFVRLASGFVPAIGDHLAFFPNHVCTTVNLSDELVVMQQGIVTDRWRVAARGRRQ
ncbi:MAG TPA: alanine racemase [Ktedonobacterales bacterium]|nr:alanine racemase [Ktedonobacterales bacterium]